MMVGSEQFALAVRIATVVVPISVYFLLLGFLNSRRTPQLLTARQDFGILLGALAPLFVLPLTSHLPGGSWTAIAAITGVVVVGLTMLAPKGWGWVIYNISADHGRRCCLRALRAVDLPATETKTGFSLDDSDGRIELTAFPLLHNVSIRLHNVPDESAGPLEEALHRTVSHHRAETPPMAAAMILVATAMLVAPLSLLAGDGAVEIVRLLTDLLN